MVGEEQWSRTRCQRQEEKAMGSERKKNRRQGLVNDKCTSHVIWDIGGEISSLYWWWGLLKPSKTSFGDWDFLLLLEIVWTEHSCLRRYTNQGRSPLISLSTKECNYKIHASQTSSKLTKFIEK
jgi:hypothetical protein